MNILLNMNMNVNMVSVERQSSIEKEPRTLNNNQIDFAREAALHVVSTRSIQEALTIFTEGLEPVVTRGEMDDGGELVSVIEEAQTSNKCGANANLNIDQHSVRDIVSAPF